MEKRSRRSNQDSLDRTVFLDAREPHVQALELEALAAVVDAQAVQNRGVEVVDVCGVIDDTERGRARVEARFGSLRIVRLLPGQVP